LAIILIIKQFDYQYCLFFFIDDQIKKLEQYKFLKN